MWLLNKIKQLFTRDKTPKWYKQLSKSDCNIIYTNKRGAIYNEVTYFRVLKFHPKTGELVNIVKIKYEDALKELI